MENVHLIVGLGNPGTEYAETRHNAGFMAIERFAERRRATWKVERKFQARLARGELEGCQVVLCEPLTFMNRSGLAVQAVASYFKLGLGQMLVIVDDADLPLGTVRMRGSGSSGGHHGLESIEQHLGTREYARVRVGIGRTAAQIREITGHVLGRFDRAERTLVQATLERVCDQAECWVKGGLARAMNEFNGTVSLTVAKES